jgi:hypothetical protein
LSYGRLGDGTKKDVALQLADRVQVVLLRFEATRILTLMSVARVRAGLAGQLTKQLTFFMFKRMNSENGFSGLQ